MSWHVAQIGAYSLTTPQNMSLRQCTVLGILLLGAWLFSNLLIYRRLFKPRGYICALLLSLNTLAFMAFLGTVLDTRYSHTHTKQAILVTSGVSQEKLAALGRDKSGYNTVFTLDNNIDLSGATYLASPSLLVHAMPDVDTISVLGDGLSSEQWRTLLATQAHRDGVYTNSIAVTFSPSIKSTGLVDMRWNRQITLGEQLDITGIVQAPTTVDKANSHDTTQYLLQLQTPSGSVEQEEHLVAGQSFHLSTQPKSAGQWLYTLKLLTLSSQQVLEQSQLAVSIEQPPTLRVAIWQSAPSFETKHLKDWASKTGSQIKVVTQISQQAYLRQTINQAPLATGSVAPKGKQFFSPQALNDSDILLMDGRGLVQLSVDERDRLGEAVESGMGLLVFADNDLADSNLFNGAPQKKKLNMPRVQVDKQAEDELAIIYPQRPVTKNAKAMPSQLLAVSPLRFSNEQGDVLLNAPNQRPLVKRVHQGLGQVAMTLIPRSYVWKINDNQQAYGRLWHYLFKQIARNTQHTYWQPEKQDQLTLLHAQLNACLTLGNDKFTVSRYQAFSQYMDNQLRIEQPLVLNQQPEQPIWWCTHYWPQTSGWHRLYLANTTTANQAETSLNKPAASQYRYVYSPDTWPSWQQSNKHAASKEMAALSPQKTSNMHQEILHKGWFYGLLLLMLTLLWLARRLL